MRIQFVNLFSCFLLLLPLHSNASTTSAEVVGLAVTVLRYIFTQCMAVA